MSTGKASAGRRFGHAQGPPFDTDEMFREDGPVVTRIAAAIHSEVPAFRDLPVAELRRIVSSNMRRGQAAVAEGRPPTEEELEQFATVTAELARAGVPMDAYIQARGVAMRHIFDQWRARARDAGAEEIGQAEAAYALWNWADSVLIRSSAAYREVEREIAGQQEDRRAQFLRGLLDGTLPRAEAEGRAAAYGLLPGGRYMALRARAAPDVDPALLARVIESTGGAGGHGALAAILEGEVCGIVSSRPELAGEGVLGLGSAVELSALDASFRLATRALETAMAFGIPGVADVDQLSLRPAILSEDHLGDTLVRRYLEPLRALGEFGETLELTVRQYLESGLRIDESARELIVHPNTMRHRLQRFQQLTGADLRKVDDLVEVWWALQRRGVSQTQGSR
ncbi:MAG: putative transposase [Thermoleophilaceae bacterium]|nr:putative transposase [Thermoleophilaceae bacterium]